MVFVACTEQDVHVNTVTRWLRMVRNINGAIIICMRSHNILYFLPMPHYFINSLFSVRGI
jgi:hypothetical protein